MLPLCWISRSSGASVPLVVEPLFRAGVSHCNVAR